MRRAPCLPPHSRWRSPSGARGGLVVLTALALGACAAPAPEAAARADFDLTQSEEAPAPGTVVAVAPGAAAAGIVLPAVAPELGRFEVELERAVGGALAVELESADGARVVVVAPPAFPGATRYPAFAPPRGAGAPSFVKLRLADGAAAAALTGVRLWPPELAEATRGGVTRRCRPGTNLRVTGVELGEGRRVRLGIARQAPAGGGQPSGPAFLEARWRNESSRIAHRFPLAAGSDWQDLWFDPEGATGRGELELVAELPAGETLCFERPATAVAVRRPANVVLVSIDTLRADALGDAPRLAARAARGLRFERAYALSNWTLPSHAGLLLSRSYLEHGLPLPGEDQAFAYPEGRLPAAWTTLAGAFRAAGYATFATTEGGYLDPKFGFAQGFEAYSVVAPLTVDPAAALDRHLERIARFLAEQRGDRPFFLFLHTYRVHDYRVNSAEYQTGTLASDAPFRRLGNLEQLGAAAGDTRGDRFHGVPAGYLRRLYRAGVESTDAFVERALAQVEAGLAPRERLLVAITSDHGESFAEEPGIWGHGTSLGEEQIRVPLLIQANDGSVPAASVERPVSALDLAPSLLAWAGVDRPASFRGRDDLLRGGERGSPVEAMSARLSGSFAERDLAWARVGATLKFERRDRADGWTALERCSTYAAGGGLVGTAPASCAAARAELAARLRDSSEWVWAVTARRAGRFRIELDLASAHLAAIAAAEGSSRALLDPSRGRVELEAARAGATFLLFARPDRLPVRELGAESGPLAGPAWPALPGARALYADARGEALEVVRRSPGGGAAPPHTPAERERLERELRALGYLR